LILQKKPIAHYQADLEIPKPAVAFSVNKGILTLFRGRLKAERGQRQIVLRNSKLLERFPKIWNTLIPKSRKRHPDFVLQEPRRTASHTAD